MSSEKWTPEPWAVEASAQYVKGRVCRLVSSVWKAIDPSMAGANDCFCGEGGFWQGKTYDGSHRFGYRNDGEAILWIESAAHALSGIPDPAAWVAKAIAASLILRAALSPTENKG